MHDRALAMTHALLGKDPRQQRSIANIAFIQRHAIGDCKAEPG